MKFKSIAFAAALAVAGSAYAVPINSVTTADGFASVTSPVTAAGFAFNLGAFTDSFTFNLDALSSFSISLTNSFTPSTGYINFFAAVLTPPGSALSLSTSGNSQSLEGNWSNLAAGNYVLTVTGTAVGAGGATYGLSAAAVPVPEPETYAMMLGGLGMIGFMIGRRRREY